MRKRYKSTQSGVGLIEVLVTVVIISVGFLAIARMQLQSMRFSQSSYFLSQASMMQKDIVDRMRSNRAAAVAGLYHNESTGAGKEMPECATNNTSCTSAQLVDKDIAEWSSYLHGTGNSSSILPSKGTNNAQGSITLADGIYSITVQWYENLDGADTLQSRTIQYIP